MGKNKKYTAEEILETLKKMMLIVGNMIESSDEGNNIGLMYAFAKFTGDKGDSATFRTVGDWGGDMTVTTCALAAFIDENREMAKKAAEMDLVNITETFGLS